MGYPFDADDRNRGNPPDAGGWGSEPPPPQGAPRTLKITESASAEEALATAGQPSVSPIRINPGHAAASIDVRGIDDRLLALTEPEGIVAEEYRAIRTSLLSRWREARHLIHVITSATPQEGKTITSLNVGFSFAELRNRRTIVIEADLRLPQFKKLLGLPETPGLVGLLERQANLSQVIQSVAGGRVHVIAAGRSAHAQAVQLLSSPLMKTLLNALRSKFDHVVVDTPPVIQVADAGIVGAQADDVLMVARMGKTPKMLVAQAVRVLGSYNAKVSGVIATDQQRGAPPLLRSRYGYHYRYFRAAEAA